VKLPELRLVRDKLFRLGTYVRRAISHWKLGASVVLLFAGGSVALARYTERAYVSETTLLYRQTIDTSYLPTGQQRSTREMGTGLAEHILSRALLETLVKEFKLYPRVVQRDGLPAATQLLRQNINFRMREGDTIYVSFRGPSPEQTGSLVSRIANTVVEQALRMRKEQAAATLTFLENERQHALEELEIQEKVQAHFLAQHPEFVVRLGPEGQGGGGAPARAQDSQPRKINPEVQALFRQIERIDAQLSDKREPVKPPTDPRLLAARNEAEQALAQAQRSLADRQLQFTEAHPDVQVEKRRVVEAKARLDRVDQTIKRAEHTLTTPAPAVGKDALLAQRRAYEEKLAKIRGSAASGSSIELETRWTQITREMIEAREKYAQLETQRFHAGLFATSPPSQIEIIDPPYLPKRPVGLGRTTMVLMGAALGVTLALCLMFMRVFLDDHLYDRVDVEDLHLAPLLVVVPKVKGWRKKCRAMAAVRK
jgi:uncharacterized protein involved in exopolysaccharide biosynthesis